MVAEKLLMKDKAGMVYELTIRIGDPIKEADGTYATPISMDGIHGALRPIKGVSAIHSLKLALRLVDTLFKRLAEDGSIFLTKNGDIYEEYIYLVDGQG